MSAVSGRQKDRHLPPQVTNWEWRRGRRRLFLRVCGILLAYIALSLVSTLPDQYIPSHTAAKHLYFLSIIAFESLLTAGLALTLYRAIDAHLSAPARQTQGLLQLLADLTDAREHAVFGHSHRVSDRSRQLAHAMGLPAEAAEQIACAALLHDIGKIGIPDRVLHKPSGLDAEERTTMMEHAAVGGGILMRAGALASLAPIVRHHHEWYDGHGYPDELHGRHIPVGARIVAVADALDTIIGGRSYRPACSMAKALTELRRGSGGQFDPAVVGAAIELWDAPTAVAAEAEAVAEEPPASRTLAEQARQDALTKLQHRHA